MALVLALALLLEAAASDYGPPGGDDATGGDNAIALSRALAAEPPRNLTVELVLQGAGEDEQIGLRRYLRSRKEELRRAHRVVLGRSLVAAIDASLETRADTAATTSA